MGRKTYESIGHALPNRTNVVVTHHTNYQAKDCLVVNSVQEALTVVQGAKEVFVIGGAEIYQQTLAIADRIYLTKVHTNVEGDTFFSYDKSRWQIAKREEHLADQNNPYDYTFLQLQLKNRR